MAALLPDIVSDLQHLSALERVTAAGQLIEEHREAMAVLGQIRSEAVAELRREGRSLGEVARLLNVSRQHVHRLEGGAETRPSRDGDHV